MHRWLLGLASAWTLLAGTPVSSARADAYRFEFALEAGGGLPLGGGPYRQWGVGLGLRLGATHDATPWYVGANFDVHRGGSGYPNGKEIDFYTVRLGPELGFELRTQPWILRPGVGIGVVAQDEPAFDVYSATEFYVAPGCTLLWEGGVLLAWDLRPIVPLGAHAQAGLVLLMSIGGRHAQ